MPNYKPKGIETMRNLGRVGGKKSGEARRRLAVERRMLSLVGAWEMCRDRLTLADFEEGAVRLPDLSGGSHDTDWRCPNCRQFQSAKRWICRHCGHVARKRRTTRKRLRELEAEHRTGGILRMHGLDGMVTEAPDGEPDRAGAPIAENFAAVTSRPRTIGIGAIAKLDLDAPADGE